MDEQSNQTEKEFWPPKDDQTKVQPSLPDKNGSNVRNQGNKIVNLTNSLSIDQSLITKIHGNDYFKEQGVEDSKLKIAGEEMQDKDQGQKGKNKQLFLNEMSIDKFNQKMKNFTDQEYNHSYHLKNILTLKEDVQDQEVEQFENKKFTDSIDENDIKGFSCRSTLEPYVYNEEQYTIAMAQFTRTDLEYKVGQKENYSENMKQIGQIIETTLGLNENLKQNKQVIYPINELVALAIFHHEKDKKRTVRIFQRDLWKLEGSQNDKYNQESDKSQSLHPYVIHNNVLYFTSFKNYFEGFQEPLIVHNIGRFEFEKKALDKAYMGQPKWQKLTEIMKSFDDHITMLADGKRNLMYATTSMLSHLIPDLKEETKNRMIENKDEPIEILVSKQQDAFNQLKFDNVKKEIFVYVQYLSKDRFDKEGASEQLPTWKQCRRFSVVEINKFVELDEEEEQQPEEFSKLPIQEDENVPTQRFQIVIGNQYLIASKKVKAPSKDQTQKQEEIQFKVMWITDDQKENQKDRQYDFFQARLKLQASVHIEGIPKLSNDEVKNDLEGWILDYFEYYFREPFAIYNIAGQNKQIIQNKILKDVQVPDPKNDGEFMKIHNYESSYQKVCRKFKLNEEIRDDNVKVKHEKKSSIQSMQFQKQDQELCEEQHQADSMNILYNINSKPQPTVFLVISYENQLKLRRIRLKNEFSRISREKKGEPDKFEQQKILFEEYMKTKVLKRKETKNHNRYGSVADTEEFRSTQEQTTKIENKNDPSVINRDKEKQQSLMDIFKWSSNTQMIADDTEEQQDATKIGNSQLTLQIRGTSGEGIYIEVSKKVRSKTDVDEEVILKEEIQTNFSEIEFSSVCITWSSQVQQNDLDKNWYRNFQVGILDKSRQVCQVLQYQLFYNVDMIKKRVIEKLDGKHENISSYQFLKFLKNSLNLVNLKLVGINLIVMKEKYKNERVILIPYIEKYFEKDDDKQENLKYKMNGTMWVEIKKNGKNIPIRIKRPEEISKFTINSDIAGSLYKYYFCGDDDKPCTLHAQSVLQQNIRDIDKSPYVKALSVIESISDTNYNFLQKIKSNRLGFISIKKVMSIFKYFTDVIGINQQDRYIILKNQIRVILNMVPINFENFRINNAKTDFLQPIETLSCQTICDYHLDYPLYISMSLDRNLKNKEKLEQGLIDKFIFEEGQNDNDDLYSSLVELGFIRGSLEIVYDTFFSNPLLRCFQYKNEHRTEAAQILISDLMNKDITINERDVIIGAMHDLLQVDISPYPFADFSKFFIRPQMDLSLPQNKQKQSFFQNIFAPDSVRYQDEPITITMVDQRNKSSNKSQEFIRSQALGALEKEVVLTKQTELKYQVQHCAIDLHSLNFVYKIKAMREKPGLDQKVLRSIKLDTIQDNIKAINSRFHAQIGEQIVMQKIIDSHFKEFTVITYEWLLIIYTLFFCLAFIIQMNSTNEIVVFWLNISCLSVAVLLLSLMFILLIRGNYTSWRQFFTVFTCINLFCLFTYIAYFGWRMFNLNVSAIPKSSNIEFLRQEVLVSISTVIILFGAMFKIMELIRYMDIFSWIVLLVVDVIGDVRSYFIFFSIWIVMFAFFYQALGIHTDNDIDHIYYSFEDYLKSTWDMSTRGNSMLASDYWEYGRISSEFWVTLIEYFNQFIKTVNQVYLKIIMFSFLTANIMATYQKNKKLKLQNKYIQRCDMNQYSYNLYRLNPFVVNNETDLVVVSAYFSHPGTEMTAVGSSANGSEIKMLEQVLQNQQKSLDNQEESLQNQRKQLENQEQIISLLKLQTKE